ncbi:dynein axonemal heavy chain 11-like isoform X1 [Molothrus aeneus]|uniref:dynein axonemal heavy chain 11-like isoform X1 n=1 Tax=Molothrus aeneus TaxID=84833 RepID=UPI00345862EE
MAIGLFSNAKPASTTEEHIIPQGILEIQLKLPPTGMLANFHAALYGFDQFCLVGGKKKEEKEDMRMRRTGTSQQGILMELLEHSTHESWDVKRGTLELHAREGEFKSICFPLCDFHTSVPGRLRFGPQGWNGRLQIST